MGSLAAKRGSSIFLRATDVCYWLFNPPDPSAQPTWAGMNKRLPPSSTCGGCTAVPPWWWLDPGPLRNIHNYAYVKDLCQEMAIPRDPAALGNFLAGGSVGNDADCVWIRTLTAADVSAGDADGATGVWSVYSTREDEIEGVSGWGVRCDWISQAGTQFAQADFVLYTKLELWNCLATNRLTLTDGGADQIFFPLYVDLTPFWP